MISLKKWHELGNLFSIFFGVKAVYIYKYGKGFWFFTKNNYESSWILASIKSFKRSHWGASRTLALPVNILVTITKWKFSYGIYTRGLIFKRNAFFLFFLFFVNTIRIGNTCCSLAASQIHYATKESAKIHRVDNNLEQLYIEQAACTVDSNIRMLATKNVRHGHEPKIYFFMKPVILFLQHPE